MLLSYATVDFHLFYTVAADMQICAILTRSQSRVSDTQVTVKALGPLVYIRKQTCPRRSRVVSQSSNDTASFQSEAKHMNLVFQTLIFRK